MNWIDTAEVYGKGVSEALVGRALEGRRDEVLVAIEGRARARGLRLPPASRSARACEASLGRLGIDGSTCTSSTGRTRPGVPVEDTWGAMDELQDAGTVGCIGVSNFDRELIERCEAIRHVDSLQQEFSMLTLDDRELIRWCGEQGTGVVTLRAAGVRRC